MLKKSATNFKAAFLILLFLSGSFAALSANALAIDLGGTAAPDASQTPKVEITNTEPIPVAETAISKIVEIVASAQIEPQEEYKSPYVDVQGYRTVSIYVLPEKVLNEPQPIIRYRLDAFFSVDTGTIDYKRFGEDSAKTIGGGGSQEFGMATLTEEGSPEKPLFTKPTTGETGSRVLTTPIYGPFVRVVLKNLTEGERRKFRIVAYLNR